MARANARYSGCARPQSRHERGIALVTALLLLMLLTGLSVAMVLSVNSDLLVNGYYKNFRGSFYGADSGLNMVREDIQNQFMAVIPQTGLPDPLVQPIPTGTETTVANYIQSTYGTSSKLKSIVSSGSSPGLAQGFFIDTSNGGNFYLTFQGCVPQGLPIGTSCAAVGAKAPNAYVYTYNYHLTSVGQAAGTQRSRVEEKGVLTINVPVSTYIPPFFSGYGMFFDNSGVCDGSTLVPGTISGPVFTNGGFTFGTSGAYIFTDPVGTASGTAGYQFSGSCKQSAASSYTSGGTTIAPTFQGGFTPGLPKVALPPNSFSQMEAVLDGKGAPVCHVDPCTTPADPGQAAKSASLMNVTKTPYPKPPASAPSSGVFLPYKLDSASGKYVFTGGGIYVEGDAKVTVIAGSTCTATSCPQSYTITQGATTTTVTIDNKANSTVISSGGNSVTINGVPQQFDPNTGAFVSDATMLYVSGDITSLSGPMNSGGTASAGAAIQDGTALTVTADGSVTIVGDITYKTEPVTLTANQVVTGTTPACCNGKPADTLIPGADKGQALGIFTAGGDIILKNGQSSGNLQIDASIAPLSAGSTYGLVNNGNSINKLTIVGGRIQSSIKNIGATTRNVFFDKRFGGDFAPPWFPSTVINPAANPAGAPKAVWSRTQWVVQSSY